MRRAMTFGFRNCVGIRAVRQGAPEALLFRHKHWPEPFKTLYNVLIGSHLGHSLELAVALAFYLTLWNDCVTSARAGYAVGWIAKLTVFNLVCEAVICGGWHICLYSGSAKQLSADPLRAVKFNKTEQYIPTDETRGILFASSHMDREVFLTTVGILISSVYQAWYIRGVAAGTVPIIADFFGPSLLFNLFSLWLTNLWRLGHFFVAHRVIHPWWHRSRGLLDGDVGAFLYRWCHSVHHQSHNPGPFSGISMHPVEHIIYYSCVLLVLLVPMHPLAFLYNEYHASFSATGGHDGFNAPGAGTDYHYLHHSKFECNYGVPTVPLDKLFGTWVDPVDVDRVGYREAKKKAWGLPQTGESE